MSPQEPEIMPILAYPAQIEEAAPDEYLVTFRDVPEAITGAANREDSYASAIDAVSVAVEAYLLAGQAIPIASKARPGEVHVPLEPALAARILLDAEMTRLHMSGRALAERLGKDEKNVRRMLSGEASIDQTLAALNVLGIRPALTIPTRDAA